MNAKPTNPISFEKDKSIYAVDDFCMFMNWMCASVYNMLTDMDAKTGKYGLKVDLTVQDSPKLKVVYV